MDDKKLMSVKEILDEVHANIASLKRVQSQNDEKVHEQYLAGKLASYIEMNNHILNLIEHWRITEEADSLNVEVIVVNGKDAPLLRYLMANNDIPHYTMKDYFRVEKFTTIQQVQDWCETPYYHTGLTPSTRDYEIGRKIGREEGLGEGYSRSRNKPGDGDMGG